MKKVLLRTVKVGDILTVYPYQDRVKVIVITAKKINLKKSDERYCLKDYWKEKHGIILPMTFRIATCKFATTYKEYDYPLYRKCVKKSLFQYKHRKMWKIDQQYSHMKKRNGGISISEIIQGDQEDLSEAEGEVDDNKGNWHPPSDYTMYQMGF